MILHGEAGDLQQGPGVEQPQRAKHRQHQQGHDELGPETVPHGLTR